MFATEIDATVVAEGIELVPEARVLAELGVTMGQGFLWGHPVTASELSRFFAPPGDAVLARA